MILDSYKVNSLVVQLEYAEAFELWDKSGAIARRICSIWPGLKVTEGIPQQQTLVAKGVSIQTGFTHSTVTLAGPNALEARRVQQLSESFQVWRELLSINVLKRVSTRAVYAKEFPSIRAANLELISLNLVRWPDSKVFDQPIDGERNSFDVQFRFEDANSFSVLRFRTEQLKFEVDLNPAFVEDSEIRKVKNQMIVDFDRGLLGTVSADKFRMDDWIKGFLHLMRRDIGKVLRTDE